MDQRQQNSTGVSVLFFMADASDHVNGKTGVSPTVTLSKNGGAFASAAGSVSEVGAGWYALAGNASDRENPVAKAVSSAPARNQNCVRYQRHANHLVIRTRGSSARQIPQLRNEHRAPARPDSALSKVTVNSRLVPITAWP